MATTDEATAYLDQLNNRVRPLADKAHQALLDLGCASYVKTIYIGYDIEGEMVAALYAHADHLEIALALPEDQKGSLLIDASHLTWRTLPVAALVKGEGDLEQFNFLASLACQRIVDREHDVMRDNEYFVNRKRGRNASRASS